jgi:hypothetical protein
MACARWCTSRFGTSFHSPAASTRPSPNTRPTPPERRSHRLMGDGARSTIPAAQSGHASQSPCPNTVSSQFVAPDDRQKRALLPTSDGYWDRRRSPRSAAVHFLAICASAPDRKSSPSAQLGKRAMPRPLKAAARRKYGVVVYPPAGLGTKSVTTAPAPADTNVGVGSRSCLRPISAWPRKRAFRLCRVYEYTP